MKVLITGGYGFIGSHVADRFYKEGYDIYIIDNLKNGIKSNISFKHRSYIISIEDTKCEEIFKSNHFDVVVHLAAQVSVSASITNPILDLESNVLGLVNLLTLSQKYKVGKFIFSSSAAVYGLNDNLPLREIEPCNPISPYGISKSVGESYCQKWSELYGLDTICFRFSNVYGPRQSTKGEGGVVSIFVEQSIKDQPLLIHGDGNQTRDFIYVEDIADAIFRASYSTLTGVYNLSTNTQISVKFLVQSIQEIYGTINIHHTDNRLGDIRDSILSNEKISRELDWAPKYEMKEGLQRTFDWVESNQVKVETSRKRTKKVREHKIFSKYLPYIENLLLFLLITWVTLGLQSGLNGFVDIKLFYIVIIGIIYGSNQAIIAVMLSIGLLFYQKLENGRDWVSLLYDTNFFFQMAIYLFVGLVVGYSIQRKNIIIQDQKKMIDELEERYHFLNEIYTETREVKDELQLRILNNGESFGKIHSITKDLESLEPEKVFTNTVNVIKSILNVKSVSIYTMGRNHNYMRLDSHINESDTPLQKSLKIDNHDYIKQILRDGKVFVNKKLAAESPIMAAPIYHNGKIAAIISIDGLPFEMFSLYYENLFKVIVYLVESSLSRALMFMEATEEKRYISDTAILHKEIFESIIQSKKIEKEKHNTPFILLEGLVGQASLNFLSDKISSLLRESDYIGMVKEGMLQILLSNSVENEAKTVLSRLEENQVHMWIVESEV